MSLSSWSMYETIFLLNVFVYLLIYLQISSNTSSRDVILDELKMNLNSPKIFTQKFLPKYCLMLNNSGFDISFTNC